MIGVTGKIVKAAFAKYATNSWGIAASVTKGAYFASDGGIKLKPALVTDEAFGQAWLGEAEYGDYEPPDLSLPVQMRYNDHMYIFDALAMGSPNAVTISNSASGQTPSFLHVIDLADVIDGLGVTVAFDKSLYTQELTSAKVYGFEISKGDNGKIMTTYRLLGTRPTVLSSVNINSTVAVASFPALTNRVLFTQPEGAGCTFRINAQVGTSLVAASAVKIEDIRFSWARALDKPVVCGQSYIDEPADNGYPDPTLDVTYSRANTVSCNSMLAGIHAGVVYKADLTFKGSYINSTDQYTYKLEFPALKLADPDESVTGATQVKPKMSFKAYLAATTPTNMTTIKPFRLTRIMTTSVVAF